MSTHQSGREFMCVSTHLSGRAEHGADLEDLVDLAGAGEQRAQRVQLRHDGAHRPDVDRRVVIGRAQQHFRRAVPDA